MKIIFRNLDLQFESKAKTNAIVGYDDATIEAMSSATSNSNDIAYGSDYGHNMAVVGIRIYTQDGGAIRILTGKLGEKARVVKSATISAGWNTIMFEETISSDNIILVQPADAQKTLRYTLSGDGAYPAYQLMSASTLENNIIIGGSSTIAFAYQWIVEE